MLRTNASHCAGLACEFCMDMTFSCAWSNSAGTCVASCSSTADKRSDCYSSEEYTAIDVCTSGVVDHACDGLGCEECLETKCDWHPQLKCLLNCSIFDTGCFPGAVFTALDVCLNDTLLVPPDDNNKIMVVVVVNQQ